VIELESIHKTYTRPTGETVEALDGVSMTIERGELVAIVGESGSGKSTLMNIIGLLDRPSKGRYALDGRDVEGLGVDDQARLRNRRIGFVFQAFHLLGHLTALENVLLPLELAGREAARRRAQELLAEVGLEDRADHYPVQLSGGEQQRVAVARAFAAEPDLLLADEPTGSLDRATGQNLLSLFHRLHRRRDAGAVVVTHDPEVAALADRRIHLLDGRVQGTEAGPLG
jgi:putative ABC transport system ATP-binding protein